LAACWFGSTTTLSRIRRRKGRSHLTSTDAIWFGVDDIINASARQPMTAHDHSHDAADRWKHDGVKVIPGNQLDPNVPSTPGMDRKAAINFARAGAQKLWAGTVTIKPDAKTGAHHHGHLESIIYVVRGKARMRWGEHLQFTAEAGPGDFIFIPPYVPHQEINASRDELLECVLVRSDGEAVAINLDIEPAEKPETVLWVDPIHRDPKDKS
jgi:uncharacterized RmlC-like cupin family protein